MKKPDYVQVEGTEAYLIYNRKMLAYQGVCGVPIIKEVVEVNGRLQVNDPSTTFHKKFLVEVTLDELEKQSGGHIQTCY